MHSMKGAHAHLSLFKNDFGLSLAATTATKKDSDDEVMQLNRDQSIYIVGTRVFHKSPIEF